jgi:hypothetical protein
MRTRMIKHTLWICLLPVVDVAGKHKTIQFTVTCVMITIVQKTVILKSMLDHGRSFSCPLFRYSSVVPKRKLYLRQVQEGL